MNNKHWNLLIIIFVLMVLITPLYPDAIKIEGVAETTESEPHLSTLHNVANPLSEGEALNESSLKSKIIASLRSIFSPQVTVFLISMLPIFELRGSIPVGVNMFGLNWLYVWFISIVGNMLPIFFVLLFFDWVTIIFNKIPPLRSFLEWLFNRTRSKSGIVEKYKELALIFFVAIPLPLTGAWTGSLAAYLLGLKFWKSILCVFIGVLIASVIVTILSLLGALGGIIALTVLTIFFLCRLYKTVKQKTAKQR